MLLLRTFFELIRFDLVNRLGGFRRVYSSVQQLTVSSPTQTQAEVIARICEIVNFACCFYWKPVLCLQRTVVTTRLLRAHGVEAKMVIAYRPSPFFSHSWVEVDGRIINDSPAYQERLIVLDRV